MFNFPLHQILMEASLKMDGNKKIDCRAVDNDWFKASVWKKSLRGQTQLTFAKSKSVHRHCAIRHGGGLGCNLGGSKKPSSTLKATSTEMPCRGIIQMTGGGSSAPNSSSTAEDLNGDGARSLSQFESGQLASEVSLRMTLLRAEHAFTPHGDNVRAGQRGQRNALLITTEGKPLNTFLLCFCFFKLVKSSACSSPARKKKILLVSSGKRPQKPRMWCPSA